MLFPHAHAMDASEVMATMAAGTRYFLVAIDGTWQEANEAIKLMGTPLRSGDREASPAMFDVASLAPANGRFVASHMGLAA